MRARGEEPSREPAESWARAGVKAGTILAGAALAFAIVPDRLIAFLSLRVSPRLRDLLVVAWVAASFVALCWGLVALQRRAGRRP